MVENKVKTRIGFAVKVLIGLIIISIILIGLVFSFLPEDLLNKIPSLGEIRRNLTTENYIWVWTHLSMPRYLLNTFIVCAICMTCQVVFSSFAGYAFSFFDFPGRNLIFVLVQVSMMIPAEVTVICNYLQIQSLKLVNTYLGISITSLIGGASVFMMRQYYTTLPRELKEASVVDGCGDMRFLFQIAVPLSTPIIASLSITQFISVYNRYFWPMLTAQKERMQTIQIGMSRLVGSENQEYGHVLAGAIIAIVCPIIVFIFAQDYIIKGMTAGAVKG
ncbi:MAG: carbohydrate ABC transporter permease [Spirochaetales bacterium]|nr:carbohydrate ABC transporter permease [Spirochaetales bacterium]